MHASWLNQIELYFSILQRKALTPNHLPSLEALTDRLLAFGVTTVEVKSGYGLNVADEIKCLEVIAELNAEGPLELVPRK